MSSSDNDVTIEPVAVVPTKKRRVETDWQKCMFCQCKDNLSNASDQGAAKVVAAFNTRIQYEETEISTRLKSSMISVDTLLEKHPKWHKSCYASFTSPNNIDVIRKRYQPKDDASNVGETSTCTDNNSRPTTRTVVAKVDWEKCIYCQTRKREKVHQVMSIEVENVIHNHAKHDQNLKCRVGENDLIAYEAHYHSSCKHKANKNVPFVDDNTEDAELAALEPSMERLVKILNSGFKRGHVYSMGAVTEKYISFLTESGTVNPQCQARALREKLRRHYGNQITFRKQRQANQPLLLIHTTTTTEDLVNTLIDEQSMDADFPQLDQISHDSHFINSLHTVATKLRADLKSTPGHKGYDNLDQESAERCVPSSLYMLIKWIMQEDDYDIDPSLEQNTKDQTLEDAEHRDILNVCQSIVYSTSKGHKNTPKHIGTGILVHHMTRSKQLVEFLHAVGDSIGYSTVNRIDTSIAQATLNRFEENGNIYIPTSIIPDRFMHFAADNFDMQEETLDGKGTLHVTQMAVFQRGPGNDQTEASDTVIGRSTSLRNIPDNFHHIDLANAPTNHVEPYFNQPLTEQSLDCPPSKSDVSKKVDLAWILSRLKAEQMQVVPAWTGFNRSLSNSKMAPTVIGYLPIIPAPAHELDTVMTFLLRCKAISTKQGQTTTVITLDQALYHKAKELVWLQPEKLSNVIVRLGSFHTAMNFLSIIGSHFAQSGLTDIWIEAGVFSECVAEQIIHGKSWNRAVRAHKLTLEAMWRVLLESFKTWCNAKQKTSIGNIDECVASIAKSFEEKETDSRSSVTESFIEQSDELLSDLQQFFDDASLDNPTFAFWKQYIEMVSLLLRFVRADRDSDWELHLSCLKEMLPLMMIYDHTNYTRWGVVYLLDMLQLQHTAPEVHTEFLAGNFAVKETEGSFNQIATDLALEHINKKGKIAGGLVGISKIPSAMNRWMIAFSDRTRLASDTLSMAGLSQRGSTHHSDLGSNRIKRDEADVKKLEEQIQRFNPFGRQCKELVCISTNDVAFDEIKEDLLSVSRRGSDILHKFVETRLFPGSTVSLHDPIPKNKSKTFAHLTSVQTVTPSGKSKKIKADRDLFRRLLSAASSGRPINLDNVLQHELSPVPLALATLDQRLRPTDKAVLAHLLCDSLARKELPETDQATSVVIDGMAVVQALGKPAGASTFGDLADVFCDKVFSNLKGNQTRLDLVFDDYRVKSVKSGTREYRTKKQRRIRRIIDGRSVRLPTTWQSFISHDDNKRDLIRFLNNQIRIKAENFRGQFEVVVSGGDEFPSSSSTGRTVDHLNSSHEEADTKIILHVLDAHANDFKRVIVNTRDTDILLLLIHHDIPIELWMNSSTSKEKRYIPVHEIRASLEPEVVRNILGFHALTGSDSTSQFYGHGKKTSWETYLRYPGLLRSLGRENPVDTSDIEMFVIKMYSQTTTAKTINGLRVELFHRTNDPEKLPPTGDSLTLHIQRSNYQAMVWINASVACPTLPVPEESGWTCEEDSLKPQLMTLSPVPSACTELLTCGCKTKCASQRCSCRKFNLRCSRACRCGQECFNTQQQELSEDDSSDGDA